MKELKLENRWLIHGLFCCLVLLGLLAGTFFLQSRGFKLGGWGTLFIRYLFFLSCIYTGRWICIKWFPTNNYLFLIGYFLFGCMDITVLWWIIVRFLLGYIHAGFWEVLISATPVFAIGLIMGFLVTLLKMITRLQLNKAQAGTQQKQAELELLQSQLSPHFLFNTLNNLYGISLTQQSRLPQLILQLSDLLRYTVYDTQQPYVDIADEIKYLNNFIAFEKIRISDRLRLTVDIEDLSGSGIKVAPMLLIVFIENAFKHAKDTFDQKIDITIRLYTQGEQLVFAVSNSYQPKEDPEKRFNQDHMGVGLSNTKRRLELLYPGKYEWKQFYGDQQYFVELRLPILTV